MSILKLLKTPLSFIRKDIKSTVCVRTLCSESTEVAEEEVQDVNAAKKVKYHPPDKCIRYMDSDAYRTTYGDKPVWHVYVRNYRGHLPPRTRKNCVFAGYIHTATPCPICRDQYLLPHYQNVKLLKQFICPYGGDILDSKKTGVCQAQQQKLVVAIKKAQNYGLLTFHVPHRHYNYNLYNKK